MLGWSATRFESERVTMMRPRQMARGAPSHEVSIEEGWRPIISRVAWIVSFDPSEVGPFLAPPYSSCGRSSIEPVVAIRILLSG